MEARRQCVDRFKVRKEKPCQPRIILSKLSFKHEGGIKTVSDKQKLRIVTRSVLQEMLKGVLQGGRTLDSNSKLEEEREISLKVNTWTMIKASII